MKKIIYSALVLFFASVANAAGGAHGDGHIPWEAVRNQAINLSILLIILFAVLRKAIPAAFKARQETYLDEAQKTEAALKQAELELKDIKARLSELEKGETESIAKAQKDAQVAAEKIIADSKIQGQKIIDDTSLIISAEVIKAKALIREKIIHQSMMTTEQSLKASSATITQKSENGFIQDLGQVKA